MTEKRVVHYDAERGTTLGPGGSVILWPVDHPSEDVSNASFAQTSTMVKWSRDTGIIETQNTIYKPQPEE